jgi:hypothetical protein
VLRLDGALDGVERSDGKIQSGVQPPQSKKNQACLWAAVGERKGGAGNEALAKSKAVSSHRSPRRNQRVFGRRLVRGRAVRETKRWRNPKRCQATAVQERRIRNLTRRLGGWGIEFRSYPRSFVKMRVSWECSGLTELWMGSSASIGKIQSGIKPPQSKKEGSGRNFWKMITFASSRLRVRRFPLPRCSRLEAGGMAAHLFFDPPRFLRRRVQSDPAIFQRRLIG